jgi:hypothetical protein
MTRKRVFFVGLVALVAAAVAFYAWESKGENQRGLVGRTYVYSVPRPLDYQVDQADSIAMAAVENVGQAQWSVKGITSPLGVQEAIRGERALLSFAQLLYAWECTSKTRKKNRC